VSGSPLFVRDRRHVELTSAGRLLLTDAREIIALAASAQRRLQGTSGPLRLGYVSWLPDELVASVRSDLRLDECGYAEPHPDRSRSPTAAWTRRSRGLPPPTVALNLQLLWAESLVAVVTASLSDEEMVALVICGCLSTRT